MKLAQHVPAPQQLSSSMMPWQGVQEQKKDKDSRRGLMVLLSRRRKQLAYLRRADFASYVKVRPPSNLLRNMRPFIR